MPADLVISLIAITAGVVALAVPTDAILHLSPKRRVDLKKPWNHPAKPSFKNRLASPSTRKTFVASTAIKAVKVLLFCFLVWWVVEITSDYFRG
jgi:hypothetical protein